MKHRYKTGDSVTYQPVKSAQQAAHGTYKVIQRLPLEGGVLRYKIKNMSEVFERIATESELAPRA
ncbi:MAG: hypothetical protein ACOYLQ_00115 [Hyphomicrobiaceae bacterium]